jgi:hypothetical protein
MEETVKGASKWQGNDLIDNGKTVATLSKNENGTWSYTSDLSEGSDTFKTKTEAMKDAEMSATGIYTPNETKYSSYQLPDGKSYKEVLIKAPAKQTRLSQKEVYERAGLFNTLNRTPEENARLLELDNKLAKENSTVGLDFKSSHWDEPNIISHLRLNERDYNGKKVLFMEELQSDWAREGRSKGFRDTALVDKIKKYNVPADEGKWSINTLVESGVPKEIANEYYKTSMLGVPNNPLLKNWQELSVKRALKEAVDSDAEYFSWITGEQTNARYNLATHLKNVDWKPAERFGGTNIDIFPSDGKQKIYLNIDKNGKIASEGGNRGWKGKQLDEVLGKGLADKIMEKESGTLSGEGLSFGGEWAKNLYDNQVKNIVEDLTGKKVEVIDLGLPIGKDAPAFYSVKDNGMSGSLIKNNDIKIGIEVRETMKREDYIITDILGDGKFKAVPKEKWYIHTRPEEKDDFVKGEALKKYNKESLEILKNSAETFDISINKSAGQQAIKITPEIRAMIKGETPIFKVKETEKGITKQNIKEIKPIETKPIIPKEISSLVEKKDEFKKAVASKVASAIRSTQSIPDSFKKLILNNRNAFDKWSKKALEEGVTKENLGHLVAGVEHRAGAEASIRNKEYAVITKNYSDVWEEVHKYSRLLDDLDRLKRGNIIENNRTIDDVAEEMFKLKSSLTPEQMKRVEQGQKLLNDYQDRELQSAVQSGLKSPEEYKIMKEAHPNYLKRSIEDFENKEKNFQGTSGSFNVSKTGIFKAKGSSRKLANTDVSIIGHLYEQALKNEKNKATRSIMQAMEKTKESTALRTAKQVQERMKAFKNIKEQKQIQSKLIDNIKELTTYGKKASIKIKNIINTKVSKDIKSLVKKIDTMEKERNELFGEAQTMASEFEASTKIKKLLKQVENKEKNTNLNFTKLSELISSKNKRKTLDIKQQSEVISNIKSIIKTINKQVQESKNINKELWMETKKMSDIKMKDIDIPEGLVKISHFNEGIREDWLIPKDIGEALKLTDSGAADALLKWVGNLSENKDFIKRTAGKFLTFPAKTVKNLAVNWNIMFSAISNPFRDIQTILLTSDVTLKDIAESLFYTIRRAITRSEKDEIDALARKSGAYQGNVFKEGLTPEQILIKELDNKVGVVSKITHPLRLIEDIGQAMEEMSRRAVFKSELKKGSSLLEAAHITRNASIDFSKSGSLIKVLNKFIPFLNARIQGFSNLVKAIQKDPTKASRVLLVTAAYPTVYLNALNSNYASYKNVPDYEKRKYWVIMVGESNGRDMKGNPILIPHYVKIPKGEGQQVVSNVVDRVLNLSKTKYPDSTSTFFKKLIGDFSPITESNIIPAGLSQYSDISHNHSTFKEAPIVPEWIKKEIGWRKSSELAEKEQFTDKTSEVAKTIGDVFNWSPMKIDYVIKIGALNDIIRTLDLPIKGFKGKGAFEKASELPLARSIIGTQSSGEYQAKKEEEERKLKEKNTKLIESYRKIQKKLNK